METSPSPFLPGSVAHTSPTIDSAPGDTPVAGDTVPTSDTPLVGDTAPTSDTAPNDTSPADDTAPLKQKRRWLRWLLWSLLVVVVVLVLLILMANLPTRLWMPPEAATLSYLAQTTLQNITSGETFKAVELWNQSGAVVVVVRRPG